MTGGPADDPDALSQESLPTVMHDTQPTPARDPETGEGFWRAISVIEDRMANADIADFPELTRILGSVIDLQERQRAAANVRLVQRWDVIGHYGISTVALIAGSGLAAIGIGLPAFFLIGGGLYGIVPQYVAGFMKRFSGNE